MKTTSKFLSLLLTVLLVAVSFAVPVYAEDAFTLESFGDNSVRLVLQDTAFEAGVSRSFTFSVPADGSYAMFIAKSSEKNDFAITASQPVEGGEPVVKTFDEKAASVQAGYGYSYVRIGAETGSDTAVDLTAGECTLSIDAMAATTIKYIDLRYVMPTIDGSMQAVYPSDYYSYSSIASSGHVNGMISANTDRVEGYTYWADQNQGVTTAFAYDRRIHVNGGVSVAYKINVTKAGNYRVAVDHMFYAYQASKDTGTTNRTGYVTLSLDGTEALRVSGEIVVGGNGGTSDNGNRGWRAVTLSLTEGVHTIQFASSGLGAYVYHLTLEETAEVPEDTVVHADNNLTRIIANASALDIAAETGRTYEFSVPTSGTYFFAAPHPAAYSGTIAVNLRNVSTQQNTEIYNGTWTDGQNGKYAKLGDCNTKPVALEADVVYQLTVTPSADLTVNYIDVNKTEIPVNGKLAFPAYLASASNMILTHMNSDDSAGTVIPSDYSVVANYASDALLSTKTTGILGNCYLDNKGNYITYTLDVQTPGYYTLSVASGHWENTEVMEGTVRFELDGVEFGKDSYYATNTNKSDTLVAPSVYLTAGAHALTLKNMAKDGGCGMYVKYLMLDPAEAGTGVVDATVIPAYIPCDLAQSTTGERTAEGLALDKGESATWSILTAEGKADLRIKGGTIPEGATVSYSIGDISGEADISATDKIFEDAALPAGTLTLTITSGTDGLVLGRMTLCEKKAPVEVKDVRTSLALTGGTIVDGNGSVSADSVKLEDDAAYEITYNIANSGYYTVYVYGLLEQHSFEAYFDGVNVTTSMYKNSMAENISAAKSTRYKRLAVPTYLEAGNHVFVLDINEGYTGTFSSMEVRRTDGPLYKSASEGERVISSWDFVSCQNIGDGWFFPHQYSQGTQMSGATGYTDFTLRNVVLINSATYIYKLSVDNPGYYDLGAYLVSGTETVALNMKIDDTTYIVSGDVVSGSVNKIAAEEPVFLDEGEHTITVSRNSGKNTTRFHGLSFTRAEGADFSVDAENSRATVAAYLGDGLTGTAVVAIYRDKELVGTTAVDLANATNISETLSYTGDAPTTAKVIYLKNLENVEPMRKPFVLE